MERSAKRSAASAAIAETEARPAKRQKIPGDSEPAAETVETTTTVGLKFVECLKSAKDKTGRPIASHFLELPDKNQIPEYYEEVKLPIALSTIEDKLKRGQYATLAQVESDCKRMVNNAKQFNDKKSLIFEDAERVRKTASNFMVKYNPAYRDGNYQATATPIPGEETNGAVKPVQKITLHKTPTAASTPETTARPRRAAAPVEPAPSPAPSRSKSSRQASEQEDDDPDFTGKTFVQAQDQIIKELINYVEPESGLPIFKPFATLPSRSLKDYYALIAKPRSLSGIQKKVRGIEGKSTIPTWVSEFKSWHAFEEETSLIWRNAREYNEDGSDIYRLSVELEQMFKARLAEAKSKVEEPPQPKLKINMSQPKQPSLKIRLGGNRNSPTGSSGANTPAARSSATPGIIVDSEALERQQRHVKAGMNGGRPPSAGTPQPGGIKNPFGGSRPSSGSIPPLNASERAAVASPPVNGIKNDPQSVQSPALNSISLSSAAPESKENPRLSAPAPTPVTASSAMPPPPPQTTRTTSGSPFPNGTFAAPSTHHQPPPPNYYVPPTAPQFANQLRPAGKSIAEALIPSITLNTHPALNLPKPWTLTIPASKEKTQQSVTITVPHTHHSLQITPYLPVALTDRGYRVFVHVNSAKVYEVPRLPQAGSQGVNGVPLEGGKMKGRPLYEGKLVVGAVNRVEVECIAEKKVGRNGEGRDPKEMVEVEKCTVFVHVMRP